MRAKFYLLADAIRVLEPLATTDMTRWNAWHKACSDLAAFCANGDEKIHVLFMEACGL